MVIRRKGILGRGRSNAKALRQEHVKKYVGATAGRPVWRVQRKRVWGVVREQSGGWIPGVFSAVVRVLASLWYATGDHRKALSKEMAWLGLSLSD